MYPLVATVRPGLRNPKWKATQRLISYQRSSDNICQERISHEQLRASINRGDSTKTIAPNSSNATAWLALLGVRKVAPLLSAKDLLVISSFAEQKRSPTGQSIALQRWKIVLVVMLANGSMWWLQWLKYSHVGSNAKVYQFWLIWTAKTYPAPGEWQSRAWQPWMWQSRVWQSRVWQRRANLDI